LSRARAILKAAVGVLLLVVVLAALGAWAREPVEAFSRAVVDRLGLGGVFLAVMLLDPVPVVGFQPFVLLGATGGLPLLPLFGLAWAGAALGTVGAWTLGGRFGAHPRARDLLARARIEALLLEHGATALCVAAVGPLPYGLATFGAGAVGVPLRTALLGALARGLKIGLSVAAVAVGWGVGQARDVTPAPVALPTALRAAPAVVAGADGPRGPRVVHWSELEVRAHARLRAEDAPDALRDARCVVRLTVDAQGVVGSATPRACPDALHSPAVAAGLRHRFGPHLVDGVAQPVAVDVAIPWEHPG
jgi:hypothetical protein